MSYPYSRNLPHRFARLLRLSSHDRSPSTHPRGSSRVDEESNFANSNRANGHSPTRIYPPTTWIGSVACREGSRSRTYVSRIKSPVLRLSAMPPNVPNPTLHVGLVRSLALIANFPSWTQQDSNLHLPHFECAASTIWAIDPRGEGSLGLLSQSHLTVSFLEVARRGATQRPLASVHEASLARQCGRSRTYPPCSQSMCAAVNTSHC